MSRRAPRRRRGPDRAQDRRRALVVPVVEDRREDVDVAVRHAARRSCPPRTRCGRRAPPRRAPSPGGRRRCRAGRDDGAAARRAASRCRRRRRRPSRRRATRARRAARRVRSLPLLHRAVEGRALVGVRRRATARSRFRSVRERPPRPVASSSRDGPVEDAAEQVREVAPARCRAAARRPRVLRKTPGSSSAKTPSLASARSRRWSVSASAPTSRASSATGRGPSASASGDSEIGDDRPARASPSAPRRRSHSCVSGARVAHRAGSERQPRRPRRPRRRTAVRQSSSSRPSRTTPTTGGSPRRSGAASSSSTAHA